MALVVESVSTGSHAYNQNSGTITAPTGIEAGDLLILIGALTVASTGFSTGGSYSHDFSGLVSDPSCNVLYKIAEASDESASTYTVTGSNGRLYCMLRVSGWTTGNPIYQDAQDPFYTTTNGAQTETVTGQSLTRLSQQLLILIATSYDSSEGEDYNTYNTPTITSSDANPTWTEVINTSIATGGSSLGRTGLYVTYATASDTSEITGWTFGFTYSQNDDRVGGLSVLISINSPIGASGTAALLVPTTTLFEEASVSTGSTGTNALHEVSPTIPEPTTKATSPTQWTNEADTDTTWTNEASL